MSTTQTVSRDPQASPPPPHREGPDFYDARHWESAYRHFDEDAVPQILLFLQDDLARSRRREAAWLSVIVHLFVVILLVNQPYLMRLLPVRQVVPIALQEQTKDKDLTFLALPPDVEKVTKRPDTNIISDKDRVAMSKSPQLDPKELRKIIDASRAGRPGPVAPASPQQAQQPAPPQVAQNNPGQQAQQPGGQQAAPPQNTNQIAQLQTPAIQPQQRPQAAPSPFKTGGYVGSQINQAARAAAQNPGGYSGQGGDFGSNLGNGARTQGGLEVLSDTMGVDFGPYLSRVLQNVRENWYNLIPEVARPPIMKKGKLAIEFAITKDGTVAGMRLVASSNDAALDRAAWGGITGSNPFPPLPTEFRGQYLLLRFYFYYNPDQNDLR